MHQAGGMGSSPVFVQWLKTRRPVLFELTNQHTQTAWLDNFQRYGLRNMAAHGLSDLNGQTASYFSFSKIPGHLTPRHAYLLEMLIPHLHVALIRALKGANRHTQPSHKKLPSLIDRENKILHWIGSGKTNWEFSQVLKISESTVKNHVQHTLATGSDTITITIDNFDLNKAINDTTNGYLGIKLTNQVLIAADASPTLPTSTNQTADVPHGNAKTVTLYA